MSNEPNTKQSEKDNRMMGAGVAIGAGLGIALGVAMDNIGVGVAIGVGGGIAIGSALSQQKAQDDTKGD